MNNIPIRWTQFIPTPVVVNFATIGPIGHWTKAPGTLGTVVGLIWYSLFFFWASSPIQFFLLLGASIYLAIAFCGEAEIRMMKRDPGEVILDEVVAIPICFIGLQQTIIQFQDYRWIIMVLGFGLFRFFDILKPLGIKKLQNLPGGLGVVVDDLAAAGATCIILHIICPSIGNFLLA